MDVGRLLLEKLPRQPAPVLLGQFSLSCRAKSRHLLLSLLGVYRHQSQRFRSLHRYSLSRRIWQHRESTGANFPALYHCKELIYYEHYANVYEAIAREKQLKRWSRVKKVALINRFNPSWLDLGADVLRDI